MEVIREHMGNNLEDKGKYYRSQEKDDNENEKLATSGKECNIIDEDGSDKGAEG